MQGVSGLRMRFLHKQGVGSTINTASVQQV